MADSRATVQFLLQTKIDDVCALHIYMSYMDTCTNSDKDIRSGHFVPFIKWVYDTNSKLDYSVLTKYSNYLQTNGERANTVNIKISHIRQFLISAERVGLIKDCVYYAKRGRKPKVSPIAVKNKHKQEEKPKSDESQKKRRGRPRKEELGFRKTFLYDLFQIDPYFVEDDIKKSFRILARVFHPDHTEGSQEKFLACQEAYNYLLNSETRLHYAIYTETPRGNKEIKQFVESIYNRIGGYETLNAIRECE